MKNLIILALLLLPSSLSVPLPSTGPWASEVQYFRCISGMSYHGIRIAEYRGEEFTFNRNGKVCRF